MTPLVILAIFAGLAVAALWGMTSVLERIARALETANAREELKTLRLEGELADLDRRARER